MLLVMLWHPALADASTDDLIPSMFSFNGFGTLGVVALWMWLFPPLRRVDRFSDVTVR